MKITSLSKDMRQKVEGGKEKVSERDKSTHTSMVGSKV